MVVQILVQGQEGSWIWTKIWNRGEVLDQRGLVGKKLAVFTEGDANDIASQVCAELGIFDEAVYVQHMEVWIRDARRDESLSKRLRGDHTLDPLHAQTLQDKKAFTVSGKVSLDHAAASSTQLFFLHRPGRHRILDPDAVQARAKKETETKDRWAKELHLELEKMEAPALGELEHRVSAKHLHLALAGRTHGAPQNNWIATARSIHSLHLC